METAVIKRFNPLALALILFIGLTMMVLVNLNSLKLWDKLAMLAVLTVFYISIFSFEYFWIKTEEAL